MKRLASLLALASILVLQIGCRSTHGVCDCDHDDDPCVHRAPWAHIQPAPSTDAPPEQLKAMPKAKQ